MRTKGSRADLPGRRSSPPTDWRPESSVDLTTTTLGRPYSAFLLARCSVAASTENESCDSRCTIVPMVRPAAAIDSVMPLFWSSRGVAALDSVEHRHRFRAGVPAGAGMPCTCNLADIDHAPELPAGFRIDRDQDGSRH